MDKNFSIFRLIKKSLWGAELDEVTQEDYEEMRFHTIHTLPAGVLSTLIMPELLRNKWKNDILQQISYSINYKYIQNSLPLQVPYVILKGTSAAQYYPNPEYRIMGDIDIMTKREDFEIAYQQLLEGGYKKIKETDREVSFQKNGVIIELHRFFASLNDPSQSQYLDELIIKNITPTHILPDMINGLTLLEHISQHLEHGLGLRQIIDWMMFVSKCLSDANWPEFKEMAKETGLVKLAIISTKMCEVYLGLDERNWCAEADLSVCESLMNYIMDSGNFGNKWNNKNDIGQTVLSYIHRPVAAIKWFQERGLVNWKTAHKYPMLRPFAWIYQFVRYIVKGLGQEQATKMLKKQYLGAKKRIALFDELEIKQRSKGLVIYKDGRYVKK